MTDPVLKPWEKRAAKTAAPAGKPWEKRQAKATGEKPGPDGMTRAERIAAAKAGTLPQPSDTKLAAVRAADNVAESRIENAPSQLGTFMANLAPGVTFGFADEIAAGIDAALTDRTYADNVEGLRARDREMSDAFPKTAMAGQVAGGLAVPIGAAPRGAGIVRTGAQNALTGMGLAALYGAGNAEGGLVNRAQSALDAAPLGFAIGAASPVVANALSGVFGGIASAGRGAWDRVRGTASGTAANRAISRVIAKSGQSPDDVVNALRSAAADGQPEYRLMDATGQAGQRAASTVVRRGDDGAESLTNFLRQRQTDQSTRVPRMIEEAYDASKSAAKTTEALKASRKAAADTAYEAAAAKAAPVDVRPAVDMLDEKISKMSGSGIKPPEVVREFQDLRAKLAGQTPDGNPTTLSDYESVLALWRETRDKVDELYKGSKGNIAEALKPIRDAMEKSLADSSDMFRTANAGYREASGVINALDEGADMARPGARAQDTTSRFAAMTPEQQAAARVGYADKVLGQIEANKAITANKAAPFNSTKAAEEARAMTLNPEAFGRQMTRENEMWGTMNRALGGSRTADNLMDEAMAIPTGPGRQAVVDLLRLNFGGAAANLAIAVAPALRGQSPATRKLIADALMSADPEVALRAAAQSVKDEGVKRAIAAAVAKAGVAASSADDRFVARDAYGRPLPKPEY